MAAMSNSVVTAKVLIIEDAPNIVDLIRSNLVVRGFDTVVSAGAKVLVKLAGGAPCPTEFALLREFAVNRGQLLSRTHLLRQAGAARTRPHVRDGDRVCPRLHRPAAGQARAARVASR